MPYCFYGTTDNFPTFTYTAGPNGAVSGLPTLTFRGSDGADLSKDLPVGFLAVPTMQLGVGIFNGTELRLRYTPVIKIKETELNNWA
jgi:hypothetical protein